MDSTINKTDLPDIFIEDVATEKGVTKAELDALLPALKGFSGAEIADELNISQAAVRKRLGESYKKFQIPGSNNKKINYLKQVLSQKYQTLEAYIPQIHKDLGEAVDSSDFHGRDEEILELKRWILNERCRLIAILGLGGIGKTILAAKILKEVSHSFDYVIWRSLRNSPQLNDILTEILQFLPNENRIAFDLEDDNHNKKLLYLIDELRKHRCLIVLDNIESLFSSSKGKDHELAGKYKDGCENYGDLFKRVAETSHKSCFIITSREKPLQVAMLEGKKLPVKVLQLGGLNLKDASEILNKKGFTGNTYPEKKIKKLVDVYSGNPLALKMVATTLYDLFNNDLTDFLNQITKESAVYGDIRTLLEEQFNRLSELEKRVMYWLAIDRDFVSLAQIKKDLMADRFKVLEAVESLLRRSLIEKATDLGARRFSQQSVVMEYVTERFIALATQEIIDGNDLNVMNKFPLIKARSLDYFRESQEQSILEPLIQQLIGFFGHENEVDSRLNNILLHLKEKTLAEKGYAAGNLINLLRYLQIHKSHNKSQVDLSEKDFSNLTIWQAYLKDVKLHETKFINSDLRGSVFNNTMSSFVSLSFSNDGAYFATGVLNGEVRLWQTDGVKQIKIFKGHNYCVWTLAFESNNKIIASGSVDCKIKLWDVETGVCLETLEEHTGKIHSVAFNSDGTLLASGSEDQTIKIWDVKSGRCLKTLTGHSGLVWSVSFHPKKLNILASSSADGTIRIWDIETRKSLQTFLGHYGAVYAVDFHPEGNELASSGEDKTIKIWDLVKNNCRITLSGHEEDIYKVRFSPNGNLIASCSKDQTIKLWNPLNGECKKVLRGHRSQVWDIAFYPTERTLISCSDDQTARIWNVEEGTCWNVLKGYTRDVNCLAFSPDSNSPIIASGGDDWTIRLWNLQNFKCYDLQGHQNRIRSVAFSSDGGMLASGSADCQIKIWNIQDWSNGKEIINLRGHDNWVSAVVFSPDGKTLASSSEDRTIRIWDIENKLCKRYFTGHSSWVWVVAFNPDGTIIASGSADNTVKLWNVNTGECIKTLQEHQNSVRSLIFSQDGKILATCSEDSTIKLWNLDSYQCLHTLREHSEAVYSLAFSPDSKVLASGSGDNTVKLWDTQNGKLLHTLTGSHTNAIRCVAFSPDGGMLASGGEDEKIQLWDFKTFEPKESLYPSRFYKNMDITNIKGLTDPEKASLIALGAVEND